MDDGFWNGDRPALIFEYTPSPCSSDTTGNPNSRSPASGAPSFHDGSQSGQPFPPDLDPSLPLDTDPDILEDPGWASQMSDPMSQYSPFDPHGKTPSFTVTAPSHPPHQPDYGYGGYEEISSDDNTVASIETPQAPTSRLPCPFLESLKEQRSVLSPEIATAIQTICRHQSELSSSIQAYHQMNIQRLPQPTPTAPPSVQVSLPSTVTDLPRYACAGLHKTLATSRKQSKGEFGCAMCPHRCNRKNDMSKHMSARNTNHKYRCTLGSCKSRPKTLPRRDKYRDHIKTYHRGEPSDNDSLAKAAFPFPQYFPETCLHCSKRMTSWDDWFDHWVGEHNDPDGGDVHPKRGMYPASVLGDNNVQSPRMNLDYLAVPAAGTQQPMYRWANDPNPCEAMQMQLGLDMRRQDIQNVMQNADQHFSEMSYQ